MAADKYLAQVGGKKKVKQATDISAGAGDAGKIVALGADGKVDPTMIAGLEVQAISTSETLAAGDIVNLHNSSGVKVRKATNTGFATRGMGVVKAGATHPSTPSVYFEGIVAGYSGLTIGEEYYLGVNGAIVLEASLPSGTLSIVQKIGIAISATELMIEIGEPTEL